MSDLWINATADHEAELAERQLLTARTAAANTWAFLAGAEGRDDFENRLALVGPQLDKATEVATGSNPSEFVSTRIALQDSFTTDFEILLTERQREAQVANARRAALRAAEREAKKRAEAALARRKAERQKLDPNESYAIRAEDGSVIYTHVFGTEAEEILAKEPGLRAVPQMGPYRSARRTAQIDDSQSSFTLNPDDERWIGNFTDRALLEMEQYWANDAGATQPNLSGYDQSTLKLIRDEKARRGLTASRRMATWGPNNELICDGWCNKTGVVTSIDDDGYIYCTPCANRRRGYKDVRRLTEAELEALRSGQPVAGFYASRRTAEWSAPFGEGPRTKTVSSPDRRLMADLSFNYRDGSQGAFDWEARFYPYPPDGAQPVVSGTAISPGDAMSQAERAANDYFAEHAKQGSRTAADMPGFYRSVPHGRGRESIEWVPEGQKDQMQREKEELFPDGIPLRGELTPEQEAWLKSRASRTAAWDKCRECGGPLDFEDSDSTVCEKCEREMQRSSSWSPDDLVAAATRRTAESETVYCDNCGEGSKTKKAGDICPVCNDGQMSRESSRRTASRPLHEIAADIRANWSNVYFGAEPYLDAMSALDSIDDRYGSDDARGIVAYFLSNATGWRGEKAREIKAELKAMTKRGSRTAGAYDQARWVYVDGGRESGWFTDDERAEVDSVRQPGATYSWREITEAERASMNSWYGEQASAQASRRTAAMDGYLVQRNGRGDAWINGGDTWDSAIEAAKTLIDKAQPSTIILIFNAFNGGVSVVDMDPRGGINSVSSYEQFFGAPFDRGYWPTTGSRHPFVREGEKVVCPEDNTMYRDAQGHTPKGKAVCDECGGKFRCAEGHYYKGTTATRKVSQVGGPCSRCEGRGWVKSYIEDDYEPMGIEIDCPNCGGSGIEEEEGEYLYADDPLFTDRLGSRKEAAAPIVVPEGVRGMSPQETARQIGAGNIMAISGGRVQPIAYNGEYVGIHLPVSNGYAVNVFLAANDTYIVQRTYRGAVKGEMTGIYADQVGEIAYQAHAFQNGPFGATAARTASYPSGRSDYKPGQARMGEPTPQSNPEQFSSEDILAEIKYLIRMNERLGSNPLRTMAYTKLMRVLQDRGFTGAKTAEFYKGVEVIGESPIGRVDAALAEAGFARVEEWRWRHPSGVEVENYGYDPLAMHATFGINHWGHQWNAGGSVTFDHPDAEKHIRELVGRAKAMVTRAAQSTAAHRQANEIGGYGLDENPYANPSASTRAATPDDLTTGMPDDMGDGPRQPYGGPSVAQARRNR